jgi:hypothetical protein
MFRGVNPLQVVPQNIFHYQILIYILNTFNHVFLDNIHCPNIVYNTCIL